MFASGVFPDGIAKDMNGYIGKLSQGGFNLDGLKGIIGDMMGLVDKLGSSLAANPTGIPNIPLQTPSPTASTVSVKTSPASVPATSPPPFKAPPNSVPTAPAGKGAVPQVVKPGRFVATTAIPFRRTK